MTARWVVTDAKPGGLPAPWPLFHKHKSQNIFPMLLQKYYDLCYRAHSGTSFSPERRAKYYVAEYSAMLEEDLASLPEEIREAYQEKFERLFTTWMARKSNCISSMITGPARFPTRRAERANRGEETAGRTFFDWRERFLKRVNNPRVKVTLDGELEQAMADLDKRQRNHEHMKAVNAICRKKNAAELLAEQGWSEHAIHTFLNPAFSFYGKGYPKFELTNNLANIKRLEERVAYLLDKVERRDKGETEVVEFPGGKCVTNRVEYRIQFIFDSKPDNDTRTILKQSGLNWSPTNGAWQRKITPNAFASARQLIATLKNRANAEVD
jgi:hypothetical protein